MWKVVEEAMRNGQAALEELQERRPEKTEEHQSEKPKPKAAKEKLVSKPSPSAKSVPPSKAEPEKPERALKIEGNRRQRRAKGIFNEKGPAGSGENGEDFFA